MIFAVRRPFVKRTSGLKNEERCISGYGGWNGPTLSKEAALRATLHVYTPRYHDCSNTRRFM